MKVIHIESGLGNQMLSYCEYLSMKEANPNDDIYIENIIYEIPECNKVICQWNGYELDKVFKINAPNVKTLIGEENWAPFLNDIHKSEFWIKNWNYPVYFVKAFEKYGINLVNTFGNYEDPVFWSRYREDPNSLKYKYHRSLLYQYIRRFKETTFSKFRNYVPDRTSILFPTTNENLFAGQKLFFKFKGSGIERIENKIRSTFIFPEIFDPKNIEAMSYFTSNETVAIHARRGDMLGTNGYFYRTGYFRKAVSFIRKHTCRPIFVIFCDPQSVQWAKDNSVVLGLNFKKDEVVFVDWNKSEDSFRDMQLMSKCKHQVITNSTFGWWGAWLNANPEKITCSPQFLINTTHTF